MKRLLKKVLILFDEVKKRENLKNTLLLLIGSGLSQIIPIAISPILTRMYSVHAFGVFGFTQSIITPMSAIACGRFELTVVLAKNKRGAESGVVLSYLFSLVLTILFYCFVLIFQKQIYLWFGADLIESVYFFIPLFLLFQGIHIVNLYWLQRNKLFKKIAAIKFVQHSFIGALSLILVYVFPNTGLVLAMLIGWFLLDIVSYYQIVKTGFNFKFANKFELIKHFKRYYEYPLYNAITAFLYYSTLSIPTLIISSAFLNGELGYFSLTRQILFIPTSLLAGVISQVFFQRIAENIKNKKEIWPQFYKLFVILLVICLLMIGVLFPFGIKLFSWIFGQRWSIAGEYAKWMVFIAAFQFLGTSMLNFLPALKKLKLFSAWQLLYFFTSLLLFAFDYSSVFVFFKYYAVIDIFFFSILIFLVIRSIFNFDKSIQIK